MLHLLSPLCIKRLVLQNEKMRQVVTRSILNLWVESSKEDISLLSVCSTLYVVVDFGIGAI